jgi:hypothetical protein
MTDMYCTDVSRDDDKLIPPTKDGSSSFLTNICMYLTPCMYKTSLDTHALWITFVMLSHYLHVNNGI